MAVFQCTFRSEVLAGNADFNVIVPNRFEGELPAVYLLHGLAGNQNDWLRFTSIERYADDRGLAVVLPDAGRSFYADMKFGGAYFTYIAEELTDYTRKIFPLSKEREKTFVAGLSMGGYGALKLALTHSDRYAACASLSGIVDINERVSWQDYDALFTSVWGDDYVRTVPGSDQDLYALACLHDAEKRPKPGIFQVCGTEDRLYPMNQSFKRFIEPRGYRYEYHEGPGKHTWDFWDQWIQPALDFFVTA